MGNYAGSYSQNNSPSKDSSASPVVQSISAKRQHNGILLQRKGTKISCVKSRKCNGLKTRKEIGGTGAAPFTERRGTYSLLGGTLPMRTRHHGHRISLLLSAADWHQTTSDGSIDPIWNATLEAGIQRVLSASVLNSDKNWWTREECKPEIATHQKLSQHINKDTEHSSGGQNIRAVLLH